MLFEKKIWWEISPTEVKMPSNVSIVFYVDIGKAIFIHWDPFKVSAILQTPSSNIFLNSDFDSVSSVREITKSSSTFSATNISSNMLWLLQLHDTIQMKSNYIWIDYNHNTIAIRNHIMIYNFVWNLIFGTKFSSIYFEKEKKAFSFSTIIC